MHVGMSYKTMLLQPFLELAEDWKIKAVLSIIIAAGLEIIKRALGLYGELFATEPVLILFLITLIVFDLFAGTYRSVLNGSNFSFKRFARGATLKMLEYLGVCYVLIGMSNAFDELPVVGPIIEELGNFGLLWACWTEGVSIIENITGSKRVLSKIARLIKRFKPEAEIADLLDEEVSEKQIAA